MQISFNEIITSRRDQSDASDQVAKKDDILSQLLEAHDSNEKLTTSELIGKLNLTESAYLPTSMCYSINVHPTGNIFIFMIAGHETTAHTLGFIMSLLSLYPDVQDKLVQHIAEVRPKDRDYVRLQSHSSW